MVLQKNKNKVEDSKLILLRQFEFIESYHKMLIYNISA